MTRFKKCDYCKQTTAKLYKLKSKPDFLQGKDKVVKRRPGGWEQVQASAVVFLCELCYDYLVPKVSNTTMDEAEVSEGSELDKVFEKKSSGKWV